MRENTLFCLKKYLLPLACCCFQLFVPGTKVSAQHNNLGVPPVKNFTNKTYRAGTQNWQITQDKRGVIYAANNEGLLEFDGSHWRSYAISNGTSVRSVHIAEDGKIYVGGQGEIGYFEANEMGMLTYQSLSEYFPDDSFKFEDVWDIIISDGAVYFLSWKMIIKWENGKISAPLAGEGYLFLAKQSNRFFIQKANLDFGYFADNLSGDFQKLTRFSNEVTSMLPQGPDTLLITTEREGIFQLFDERVQPWPTSIDPFLRENRVFCSSRLPNGQLVLGTTSAGVIILDNQRRIFQQVSRDHDLQNNTVLSLFADNFGNLWAGLDNGIDYIQANSPFSEFFPDGSLGGTCYAAAIYDGKLYTGTNTGVYQIPWQAYYLPAEKRNFTQTANTNGQVWSIAEYNDQLLVGHQNGPLIINGQQASLAADLIGVWRFLPLNEQQLVAGHYGGLALFRQSPQGLKYAGMLAGLDESCRLLAEADGRYLWMAHPYRGIYKVAVYPEEKQVKYEFFGIESGLPTEFNNHLFQLSDRVVFTGEKGVFQYDRATNRFLPDETFNQFFGADKRVKYLKEDKQGNIWYVVDDKVGILWVTDDALEKHIERMDVPELSNKLVGGFEFILPIDEQNVLFATEKGFIHFDPTRYNDSNNLIRVILSEVWLKGEKDSLLFGGYFQDGRQMVIPALSHLQNALEFNFSANDHEGLEFIEYAHKLEGGLDEWSGWSKKTSLNINNLRPGNYTLHLKARNKAGLESPATSFQFIIDPPWYSSPLALAFYGLLLVGCFLGLAYFQNKKYQKEKAFLKSTHQLEQEKKEALVQQSKEKINLLEREKLEAEVKFKNQELAATTMNLLQKSEMLSAIEASLEKMKKQDGKREDIYSEINRLLKMVKNENDLSHEWERFSYHFDEVHSDFLKRLGEQFPNLSPNDYKLSAYLKMNLSTKEIAALMNISIRGVEASRYRLRKRLGLDTEVNLTEFLLKL